MQKLGRFKVVQGGQSDAESGRNNDIWTPGDKFGAEVVEQITFTDLHHCLVGLLLQHESIFIVIF